MEHADMLKIARDGEVIAELPKADITAAVSAGRLLPTDFYLDVSSNSWKPLSELIPPVPPVSKERFPKVIALGLAAVLFLGLAVVVIDALNQPATNQPITTSRSAVAQVDYAARARSEAEAALAEATRRVEALLPKFIANEDKFENITWYKHVDQDALFQKLLSSPPAALLTVSVNSYGGRYMKCNYFGENSISFAWVTFLVDGVKHGTRTGSGGDYKVISSCVLEWASFLDENDRVLCSTIASAAKSGKKISCRLSGSRNRVFDWDPSPDELRVFADAVELADALRAKRKAEKALSLITGR